MRFSTTILRALNLRCPVCGEGKIARGLLSTKDKCDACGIDFVVEAGYFLGAIYFNYGVTVLAVLSIAIPLVFLFKLPTLPVVAASCVFCVLFPLWFFRYARSLWLSLDYFYDRRKKELPTASTTQAQPAVCPPQATQPPTNAPHAVSGDGGQETGAAESICPLCHHRFLHPSQRSHVWANCPECHGDVFLLPIEPSSTRRAGRPLAKSS